MNDLETAGLVSFFLIGTIAWVVGFPTYRVWYARQKGLADLAKAKSKQQIQMAQNDQSSEHS